ncbi:GNAT family N-acetyltransferase [Haloplasma contractile]|nr:GNAT family protein [Haloplasma contractile]
MKFIVREIIKEDIEIMHKWAQDKDIAKLSDANPNESFEQFSSRYNLYFNKNSNDGIKLFGILLDEKLIGRLELGIDKKNRSGSFGILIGEKQYWGRGIGKKAINALFNYAFIKLDLNRISCDVYAFNKRSLNLMKSVGMKLEGRLRQKELINKQYVDLILFGLLKKEYNGGEGND